MLQVKEAPKGEFRDSVHWGQKELQEIRNSIVLSIFYTIFRGEDRFEPQSNEPIFAAVRDLHTTKAKLICFFSLPFISKVSLFTISVRIFWQLCSNDSELSCKCPLVMSVVSILVASKALDTVVQTHEIFDVYECLIDAVTYHGTVSTVFFETVQPADISKVIYELELRVLTVIDVTVYNFQPVQKVLTWLSEDFNEKKLQVALCVLMCMMMRPHASISAPELMNQVLVATDAFYALTYEARKTLESFTFRELENDILLHIWHVLKVLRI